MNICVYGASSETIDKAYLKAGEDLGRLMAEQGHTLIFGGGSTGMMGAVARGVYAAGGRLTGIVPSFFNVDGILFEHCTEMIRPDTMRARKQMLEERSDGFILTPGGIGSFDEFFEILTLKQLGRHGKPIALLNTLDYYAPLVDMLERAAEGGFLSRSCLELFALCATPEEALRHVCTAPERTGSIRRLTDYNK